MDPMDVAAGAEQKLPDSTATATQGQADPSKAAPVPTKLTVNDAIKVVPGPPKVTDDASKVVPGPPELTTDDASKVVPDSTKHDKKGKGHGSNGKGKGEGQVAQPTAPGSLQTPPPPHATESRWVVSPPGGTCPTVQKQGHTTRCHPAI